CSTVIHDAGGPIGRGVIRFARDSTVASNPAIHNAPAAPRVSANPADHASVETIRNAAALRPAMADQTDGLRTRPPIPNRTTHATAPGRIEASQCEVSAR